MKNDYYSVNRLIQAMETLLAQREIADFEKGLNPPDEDLTFEPDAKLREAFAHLRGMIHWVREDYSVTVNCPVCGNPTTVPVGVMPIAACSTPCYDVVLGRTTRPRIV